jgi:DNA-binding response OmpR family regulator
MICSAAIIREHEDALLGLGVDHFLTKPYHPDNLLAQIRLELDRPEVARPNTLPMAPIRST